MASPACAAEQVANGNTAVAPKRFTLAVDYKELTVKNQWYRAFRESARGTFEYGHVRIVESWHGATRGTFWTLGFELGPGAKTATWEQITGTKFDYRNQDYDDCPIYSDCWDCDTCMDYFDEDTEEFSDHCANPTHAKWKWLDRDYLYLPMDFTLARNPPLVILEECADPRGGMK